MIFAALAPFTAWLLALHLVMPDMTIEVFEFALPTQDACYHFAQDVVNAFEAAGIEANPSDCQEQTWYYEDGSI